MKIGEAIKELRKNKNVTQGDLAMKVDISQTSLSQIETGATNPTNETLKKICHALGISEALLHLMTLNINDIPEDRRFMFEALYPTLKNVILQISGKER